MASQKKLPKILERDEVQMLLNSFNLKAWSGLRNRVIFETLYRAGLRVSELCNLKLSNVNLEKRLLRVFEGKGKKDRVVPFDSELAYWLQRWSEKRPDNVQDKKASYFFCLITTGRQGNSLCQQYLDRTIKNRASKIGLIDKKVSCHVFRHCYASELLDEGFTIREVQDLLGHNSVQTTQVYTHVAPKHLADKIQSRGKDKVEENSQQVTELQTIIKQAQEALGRLQN